MEGSPFDTEGPMLVGVLNVTPDSFSDGGAYLSVDAAVERGVHLVEGGAAVIDVGGESTRPGSEAVDAAEQQRRVLPVIERLVRDERVAGRAVISIDTTSDDVAAAALDAGAVIVNDTSGGEDSAGMLGLIAERGAAVILMHRLARPAVMQKNPEYEDVVSEVLGYLLVRAAAAEAAGVERGRIAIDPGIGFGKTTAHNLALLDGLPRFVQSPYAVMVGASRKRFLGEVCGIGVAGDRDGASSVVTAMAARAGVLMHRVHEPAAHRSAAGLGWAVWRGLGR